MIKFVRKLWLNDAGHCGIAIPIEVFHAVAGGRTESFDVSLTVEGGKLIVEPVE